MLSHALPCSPMLSHALPCSPMLSHALDPLFIIGCKLSDEMERMKIMGLPVGFIGWDIVQLYKPHKSRLCNAQI